MTEQAGTHALEDVEHRLIELDSRDEWTAALRDIPHAFAHTWESCRAMQATTGYRTFLYCFRSPAAMVLCPLAERSFGSHVDVVTPYGFSGFTGRGEHPDFAIEWKKFAAAQGWVCGYLAINPILGRPGDYDPAEVYRQQDLYVLDLQLSEGELLSRFSRNRLRELRQWERSGGRIITDTERLLEFVLREHAEFYRSRGASAVYRFSPESWRLLAEMPNVRLFGASLHDRINAVTMFAYTPTIGEHLFNVSVGSPGRQASTPLLWHGALELRALGVPLLNLGGGIRADDGVAQFKQRFGARALPLHNARQVYDAVIFEQLCRDAGVEPLDRTGYFPPYRTN